MKKLQLLTFFAFFTGLVLSVNGCKKEDPAKGTDLELYEMAQETTGFVWYKNSDALLPKSNITGHSETLIRTRYNNIAATQLDANGVVNGGITFPDESLIVKELYNSATDLSTYAIMYKKANHPDADAAGWVWGYVRANGDVRDPASKKGSGCRGCHNQGGNIDFTLMNVAFP
jgi:hypothetical protein